MLLVRNAPTLRKFSLGTAFVLSLGGCSGGSELPVISTEDDKETVSKSIDDPFGTQATPPDAGGAR
ncbi:hypothetical protein [Tautonia plasticadhaerens]|uniref:Uncharacterized protein n=1 Tax=Tautonia plasticadhaerens TaxID=2527974 RepID=A0A518HBX7_9BACT|nr:hypothetical protein [Tautonia plasticadhaerens]QDV38351.1 hypothetical protein ElP_63030 [Tautonia plasticadhaerens]